MSGDMQDARIPPEFDGCDKPIGEYSNDELVDSLIGFEFDSAEWDAAIAELRARLPAPSAPVPAKAEPGEPTGVRHEVWNGVQVHRMTGPYFVVHVGAAATPEDAEKFVKALNEYAAALSAAPVASPAASPDEIGWLIENPHDLPGGPEYVAIAPSYQRHRGAPADPFVGTTDASKALRFARHVDAEAFHRAWLWALWPDARITEHAWSDVPLSARVPAEPDAARTDWRNTGAPFCPNCGWPDPLDSDRNGSPLALAARAEPLIGGEGPAIRASQWYAAVMGRSGCVEWPDKNGEICVWPDLASLIAHVRAEAVAESGPPPSALIRHAVMTLPTRPSVLDGEPVIELGHVGVRRDDLLEALLSVTFPASVAEPDAAGEREDDAATNALVEAMREYLVARKPIAPNFIGGSAQRLLRAFDRYDAAVLARVPSPAPTPGETP